MSRKRRKKIGQLYQSCPIGNTTVCNDAYYIHLTTYQVLMNSIIFKLVTISFDNLGAPTPLQGRCSIPTYQVITLLL